MNLSFRHQKTAKHLLVQFFIHCFYHLLIDFSPRFGILLILSQCRLLRALFFHFASITNRVLHLAKINILTLRHQFLRSRL